MSDIDMDIPNWKNRNNSRQKYLFKYFFVGLKAWADNIRVVFGSMLEQMIIWACVKCVTH